jgi:hypothetical protein
MKKFPQVLAFLFVVITVGRVASFMRDGLHIGFVSYFFAVGVAVGVYVSAFYLRFKQTKKQAFISLVFFMLIDLWFNEFELIRVLSSVEMVSTESNFLGFNQSQITNGLHVSALVFGAFPTVAGALLGWLQSGAERVTISRHDGNFIFALPSIAEISKGLFDTVSETSKLLPAPKTQQAEKYNSSVSGLRWNRLTKKQKEVIAKNEPLQISGIFKVSARRARMWKQKILNGQ